MPFKLKLKKTRQYNVVSKSLFVISIELLDGVVVECTLGSDSTGQECLENVCQRLVIDQSEFFGLRYMNRNQQPRWIDMDRPLKRQLDKYASSHQLYLRVMYYVINGTSLITDEVTRYHYFLQLKNDLVEGRIVCDCQQAVVLASYSRQAEYGNHDKERHTVDYLKNLLTFPKQMIDGCEVIDGNTLAESGRLEWLTVAVIQHHQTLHNLPQAQAEEGYISACQILSGYGQETFVARDHSKEIEMMIAISLTGIMVATESSDSPKVYRWTDITNVINHKRTFTIECQVSADSATFVFASPEDGKYVWRMCILQHTFFMKHQQALLASGQTQTNTQQPNFKDNGLSDSRDDLDQPGVDHRGSLPGMSDPVLLRGPDQWHGPLQRTGPSPLPGPLHSLGSLQPLGSSQRSHSTSCLDLTASTNHIQQQRDVDHLRALLPTYRAAPDYETAVQQKYQQSPQVVHYTNHPTHGLMVHTQKPLIYGSHPEIHRPVHYPDVTRHTVSVNRGVRQPDDLSYGLNLGQNHYSGIPVANVPSAEINPQIQYLNVYKPPPPYPSNGLASNSTPDLAVATQVLGANGYHRPYINPHVSGSSPDLVSSRTFLSRQYLGYLGHGATDVHNVVNYNRVPGVPNVHCTYDNLASVMDMQGGRVLLETPHTHLPNNIHKVFDKRGNIMYCMPATQVPYQTHFQVLPQGQSVANVKETPEPIYENVPLLRHSEQERITNRDRTQSLTTPNEANLIALRKVSYPFTQPATTEHFISNHLVAETEKVNYTSSNPNLKIRPPYTDNHYHNTNVIQRGNYSGTNLPIKLPLSAKSSLELQSEIDGVRSTFSNISLTKKEPQERSSEESPNSKSVSAHKLNVTNNNFYDKLNQTHENNVTSISVNSDGKKSALSSRTPHSGSTGKEALNTSNISQKTGLDSNSSILNWTQYSSGTELESNADTTKSGSICSKEKKRRRWGVFMGRSSNKSSDVKSATLGRDRSKNNDTNANTAKHRWSTGLPKLQPLPPSITKETLCQLLERKMSDSQLSFAFEQIPKGRDTNAEMTAAIAPENAAANGFNNDFLPYDDNRVRLTPTPGNKYGYINASHITMTVGSSQRFYVIAKVASSSSKKPHPGHTAGAGGTMGAGGVGWHQDSCALLWLAALQVGANVLAHVGGEEAPPYLPLPGKSSQYGQVHVHTESSQAWEFCVASRVRLGSSTGRPRALWHLHYTHWPQTHAHTSPPPPDPQHFLGFLSEMGEVRRHSALEVKTLHDSNAPALIACEQGAGRSGTLLAADLLLHALDHNQELDIPRTVGLLHQQRANLIQNLEQYRFLHALLVQYLKQSRLI